MAALFDVAIERGAEHLTLEVRPSNTAAIDLYRRFGFVAAGTRLRYYPDGEDATVMWAHDVATDDYAELLGALERQVPGTTVVERPKGW